MSIHLDDSMPAKGPDKERKVTFAPTNLTHHLPEKDALFAHITLKRQVKHLLQMAPSLTPFLDALLKHPMPSEVKMAEMGMIEAYFEQNRNLIQSSFLDDFVETGGALHSVLFDFLGDTSDARKSAVMAIANRIHLPNVERAVKNRLVMRMLKGPIKIHPSLKYLLQGYDNVQQGCIDALFRLPPRADIHFFPLPDILNWLLETLCSGVITLDENQLPVAELQLTSLPDLILYFFRLHDANYGIENKGVFISAVMEHLEGRFKKLPDALFQELTALLYQRLWFEERERGVVTPFILIDGRYMVLNSYSALQRAFVLLAIESQHCKDLDLLREYLSSDDFRNFLVSYALVNNPEACEERFSIQAHPECSPETLAQVLRLEVKMLKIYASSPSAFIHHLNKLVCQEKATNLLFVGEFTFDTIDTPIFTLQPDIFHSSVTRKLFLPLKEVVTDKMLVEKKDLMKLFKKENLPESVTGTAFEIAKQIASPGEDFLPLMQAVEHYMHHPITLPVGRMGDGHRLICQMNIYTEKPQLYKMTDEEIFPLDFENFKELKVVRLVQNK